MNHSQLTTMCVTHCSIESLSLANLQREPVLQITPLHTLQSAGRIWQVGVQYRNYSLATPRKNLQEIKPQNIDKNTDETIPREENKPNKQTNTEEKLDDRFYNWKKIIEERNRKIEEEEKIVWERNEKSMRQLHQMIPA